MRWLVDVATIMAALVLCYGGLVLHERIVDELARRRDGELPRCAATVNLHVTAGARAGCSHTPLHGGQR